MAGFLPQLLHRPAWQRQLIALAIFFIALGLRLVLLPVDGTLAYLTFYPAAVLSFVLLGIGPGWLVVGLCAVAGNVFFTAPLGSLGSSMPGLLSMAMYLLSCGLMAWAVARHHHMARQLALTQAQLQVRGVALTEGERFLQKLTDHLPVRLAYCDFEGRYRFINLAHCHRFKLPRTKVLGSTRAELLGAGPADPVTPRVAAALRGQPQRFEYDDLVDGEHRRIESIMVPDLDASGQVVGFFTSGSDITERVAAQRALSESEALLRRTGHVAGVGGWQLDLRTREVVWSQQTRAILEVEPDFAPTFEGIKDFYAPGVQATVEAAIDSSIRHGAPWHLELPMLTAKGRAIRVLAVGEVEFEGGRPARLLGALQDVSKQHALEAELAKTAARATDLYENAPCGYYSVDAAGTFVRVNELALSWLGCTREQVIGQLGPTDFFSESGQHFYRLMSPVFIAEGRIGPIEFELRSRDGTVRWVSVSATAIRDADGQFVMSRSVMYDVTETHQARSALHSLSAEQTAMLDNDLVAMVKLRERRTVWKNKALERLFGYSHDELINQPSRLLYCDDASFDAIGEAANAQLSEGKHFRQQLQMRRKGGDKIWVDISGFMVSPESGESMWMMTDITALKAHQSQIEHLAFHDALTGLPNRRLLADRMAQGVVLCERLKCQMLVCFMDLDGFKAVNDLHGHDAGDLLLKEIARRLQSCVRASDTVARLGGDEFVLLLTPLDMLDEGRAVTQRVIEAVAMPVLLGPSQVAQVTASIGLASFPEDGREPASLLQQADAAMYQRKRQLRSQARGKGVAGH